MSEIPSWATKQFKIDGAVLSVPLTPEAFDAMLRAGIYASSVRYSDYLEKLAEAVENGSQGVEGDPGY